MARGAWESKSRMVQIAASIDILLYLIITPTQLVKGAYYLPRRPLHTTFHHGKSDRVTP